MSTMLVYTDICQTLDKLIAILNVDRFEWMETGSYYIEYKPCCNISMDPAWAEVPFASFTARTLASVQLISRLSLNA